MLVRQINTLTLSVIAMKIHDAEKIVGYMRMIDLCLGLVQIHIIHRHIPLISFVLRYQLI